MIFYDQVGAGVSERPASASATAPWLLTVEYYVEELQAVADALVGGGPFHVIGSSWGTVVAQEYALRTAPVGLVRVRLRLRLGLGLGLGLG